MAIISFDAGDVLKKKVIDAGWYEARLTELKTKPSKEGTSINYWTTFTIESGTMTGKEIEVCYNTNTKSRSILGSAQFSPTSDFMEIACAKAGITIPSEGMTVDTDELLGCQLDILVTQEMSEGTPFNGLTSYMPYQKSAKAASSVQF
jgi:hypothetical protein